MSIPSMEISRIFTFSAAHHLTKYRGLCERPHGHTYRLIVTVEGEIKKNGLVIDFSELKKIVEKKVLSKLDHRDLNKIFGNPSAENIAVWIWGKLKNSFKKHRVELDEIKLWEGDNTYVSYEE